MAARKMKEACSIGLQKCCLALPRARPPMSGQLALLSTRCFTLNPFTAKLIKFCQGKVSHCHTTNSHSNKGKDEGQARPTRGSFENNSRTKSHNRRKKFREPTPQDQQQTSDDSNDSQDSQKVDGGKEARLQGLLPHLPSIACR